MSDNVNIIISVQNEASKQLEQVKKDVTKLSNHQMSATAMLKKDQAQANAFYSKLDGDRLKESERISQGKIKLEKILSKQAINLQKQMDNEDRKVFASKLARDRAVFAEEEKQRKLKLKQEQLLAKQQLAIAKQVEAAKKLAAKEAAAIELQSIRDTERAERTRISTLRSVASLFRQVGGFLRGPGLGLLGGGALGGYLGYKGYDEAKEGARAEEIRRSFESTFGAGSNNVLTNIRATIKGITDDTTIMKEAIKQNIEGISPETTTRIFKLGALASQKFGLDSQEGIELARKAIVEFDEQAMVDLGILNKRDASYQTFLKVVDKSSKGLNAFARINMQNAYIQDRMNTVFGKNAELLENNFEGFQKLESSAINLKNAMAKLLNSAFGPMARTLGNWIEGVAELLTSFDTTTGKATISKQLASILGPSGVNSVRQIAATVLDIVNFIKGFALGVGEVFHKVLNIVNFIFGKVDDTKISWKTIGKYAGIVAAGLFPLIGILGTIISMSMIWAANLVSVALTIKSIRRGMTGTIADLLAGNLPGLGGAAEVGTSALGVGGLATGGALLGGALLAGGATYYNTQKAKSNIDSAFEQQMGHRYEDYPPLSVGTANIPLPLSQQVGTTNLVSVDTTKLESALYQTNSHLRSIDDKTSKSNFLEQHIFNKPMH